MAHAKPVTSQASKHQGKIHVIGMAHINDRPNLLELARKLDDIIDSEGEYTICFELPKGQKSKKFIRKAIAQAERNGPPHSDDFFSGIFWEFSRLYKRGVDVEPIDRRQIAFLPELILVRLATSGLAEQIQKDKYSKLTFEGAEKLTVEARSSASSARFRERLLDRRNEKMLENIAELRRRDPERSLVVMVGAAHADHMASRLSKSNASVEVYMTPRTRAMIKIDEEGTAASTDGWASAGDKLAIAKLTVLDTANIVFGADRALEHVSLISSLRSREEAEKLFYFMQLSLKNQVCA